MKPQKRVELTALVISAIAVLCSTGVDAAAVAQTCPPLPDKCVCTMNKNLVIVTCDEVSLARIAQSLGTHTIDELHVTHTTETKVESLPFNGLRSLSITNSTIESISTSAWKRIEKSLEQLSLANNKLTIVPLFANLTSLTALNLNENQISLVPEKALSGLMSLTQLRMERNKICDVPPKSLDSLKPSLVLLDISDNCLPAVPAQILRNAGNLMYLDLSGNNISEINNFELMNLARLRELRLQNNTLRRIHPMAFMNVPQLQHLFLHDNLVSTLDGNRLQAFKNLEVLDVSNNVLQTLPSLKDLPNLRQVNFDGNLISKIDTLAFSNNPRLQLISMQNNNIAQIARNSFDSLDQLIVLLLGNNSIPRIERGMLDGMRFLQQLSMRNNSLTSLDASSLSQLTQITTLDLGYNMISFVQEGTFDRLTKLFWLDLSNNKLVGFSKGVFTKKVSNILLDGNPLVCDESFNDFLTYLVANKVRTFLPFQPDIKCTGPEKYAGVRLKDLMMKKANETISEGTRLIGLGTDNQQRSLLSSFLPSLGPLGQSGADGTLPLLHSITNTIPALRNIPGLGGQMPSVGQVRTGAGQPVNGQLNSAIEEFTAPLVRFATGGQPVASDIEQLIKSIPNMVVNVPGFGDVDLSKMDPQMIAYVLKGGQVPGIDKSTLDNIVRQAMVKMHTAAAANLAGQPIANQEKVLPPLDRLPSELVTQVLSGEPLPGLDKDQTKTIMEYYTQQMPTLGGIPARPHLPMSPIGSTNDGNTSSVHVGGTAGAAGSSSAASIFSPAMFDLLKLLPPGYNLSKIPIEIISAVTKGQVPDMRLLPEDLLEHFKAHTSSLTSLFAGASAKNITIDEILEKLPVFARPELSTFVPYDINELTSEMVLESEQQERHKKIRLITAIVLALVGAVTVCVLIFFVNYTKKQRRAKKSLMLGSGSAGSRASRSPPSLPTATESMSQMRPPLMTIPKTPRNHTLDDTFGRPQLCSTLIDTPVPATRHTYTSIQSVPR